MFYVFHGDDTHSQQETLADLIAKMGDPAMIELNTTRFPESVRIDQLRQACSSLPFLSGRRLVIVEGALSGNMSQAFIEQLLEYLPQLPDTTRLIFLESQSLPGSHPLLKFAEAEENGYAKAFVRPEGRALDQWVRERVADGGGQITPRAVHVLVSNIGNDLALLANEIDKLLLYKGGDEAIDHEDVRHLCPYVAEASIFDLVDALGARDGRVAAMLLQTKLNEGADPFYLFAMIVRQFRLLIQVKELAGDGLRQAAIAQKLGMHRFVAGKVMQQSQHFTLAQLEQVYGHLLETDVGVKTGRADMTTSLNLLVAALAG